ncbi:MAG TPA: hypothetical protein VGA50_09600 [Kiloniellales bacterium]
MRARQKRARLRGSRRFAPKAKKLLARLRKYRGRMPAGFQFDRREANERR